MPHDIAIDMPADGSWEERGGWVVRELARAFDLTLEQAAGIAGNLGYESRGFETLQEIRPAVPGSRGGYGWAQWTGPRRRAFEAWCDAANLHPASDAANYGFLCFELRGSHRSTVTLLKNARTIEEAVWSVGQTYERPGGTTLTHLPGNDDRLAWALRARRGALLLPGETPAPIGWRAFARASPEALQRRLRELGYDIAVDGDPGPLTCGAALDALTGAAEPLEAPEPILAAGVAAGGASPAPAPGAAHASTHSGEAE